MRDLASLARKILARPAHLLKGGFNRDVNACYHFQFAISIVTSVFKEVSMKNAC